MLFLLTETINTLPWKRLRNVLPFYYSKCRIVGRGCYLFFLALALILKTIKNSFFCCVGQKQTHFDAPKSTVGKCNHYPESAIFTWSGYTIWMFQVIKFLSFALVLNFHFSLSIQPSSGFGQWPGLWEPGPIPW